MSDSEFSSPYYREIAPGQVFGLAHVDYTAGASVPDQSVGTIDIGGRSSLADLEGNPIGFGSMGGTITMSRTAAVPEPPTSIMWAWTLATGTAIAWGRRRSATPNRSKQPFWLFCDPNTLDYMKIMKRLTTHSIGLFRAEDRQAAPAHPGRWGYHGVPAGTRPRSR